MHDAVHTLCREQGRRIRTAAIGSPYLARSGVDQTPGSRVMGRTGRSACVGIGPGHDRHDNHVTSPLWRMSPDPGLWKKALFVVHGPTRSIFCAGRPRPWRHWYTISFPPVHVLQIACLLLFRIAANPTGTRWFQVPLAHLFVTVS
jgi:hypothetical protein